MCYHFLRVITTETNFDLILSPDDEWFQIIILIISGFGSVYIQFTQKQNHRALSWLASNITAGTSYTYLLHT